MKNVIRQSMMLARKIPDTICYNFLDGYSLLPKSIIFEITHRCNLRCKMCGYYGETGVKPNYRKELSLSEIRKIADDINNFKPFVTFTGGEPFIRKDMIEILELFKERNIKFGLLTNGTLINDNIAKKLVSLNPSYINISMDGPKEIHEQIRGENSFDRTIECIKLLKGYGYSKITINFVISKINFGYLEMMTSVAKELDVNLQFQHLQFTDKSRNDRHKKVIKKYFNFQGEDRTSGICTELYDFDLDTLIRQIKKIREGKNNVRFMPDLDLNEIKRYYIDLDNYVHSESCNYPWQEARINPYGEMVYCIMEPIAGNILDSNFKDVWNNANMKNFRLALKKEKLFPNCARCCKI